MFGYIFACLEGVKYQSCRIFLEDSHCKMQRKYFKVKRDAACQESEKDVKERAGSQVHNVEGLSVGGGVNRRELKGEIPLHLDLGESISSRRRFTVDMGSFPFGYVVKHGVFVDI